MAGPVYEEVSTNTKLELRESVAYEPVRSIQLMGMCSIDFFKAFSINYDMVTLKFPRSQYDSQNRCLLFSYSELVVAYGLV